MLEFALIAYFALAGFFLLMARSENRRKGQKNRFASFALSLFWPVLLLMLALHLVIASRQKPVARQEVQRAVKLKTQRSH